MRIVIDLQSCQTTSSRDRGIGRLSLALTEAMVRENASNDIWVALNANFPDTVTSIRRRFEGLLPLNRIVVFHALHDVGQINSRNAWRTRTAEALREHFLAGLQPDIVHVSSLFEGLGDDAVTSTQSSNFSSSVTLYDLIPYLRPEVYLADKQTRSWYMHKIDDLKKATLLLAISEHSRQEATEALQLRPEQVVNISAAVGSDFKPIHISSDQEAELRQRYRLYKPFVMYTGGIEHRKNIEGLISAFAPVNALFRSSLQLAIVCSVQPAERERLLNFAARDGLSPDDVVFTGFVPDEDLVRLYNLCRLFVFPSLHEGFGLPVLEAMACGAAVIAANNSSLPEIIGRDDTLFDATDQKAIAQAMVRALSDEDYRKDLRNYALRRCLDFSWQKSARRALSAFEELSKANRPQPSTVALSSRKPRLAFVSPMPPEKTGIASYSVELISPLASHYEIEIVADQAAVDQSWSNLQLPVRSVDWFKENAQTFDRILYQFGNSSFHAQMFELLEGYPGVVVLHDFFLSDLVHYMDATGIRPGSFPQALYRCHGYQALHRYYAEGVDAAVLTYPANKDVLDLALGIIVHSQLLRKAASDWYGPGISENWSVIRQLHAVAPSLERNACRQRLGVPTDSFLICSFGIIHSRKLDDCLLDSFLASSLATTDKCHLIFVGDPIDKGYEERLRQRFENHPAGQRVHITGYVEHSRYRDYLGAADVAVQLRQLSRGEVSRSVLDAMSHGLPLIVNARGTMAELPDEVVIKLREQFDQTELTAALEKLYYDSAARERLGSAARSYIHLHHHPMAIAQEYRDAIEYFTTHSERSRYLQLISEIRLPCGEVQPLEKDLVATAVSLASNVPPVRLQQLLIDVTGMRLAAGGDIPASLRTVLPQLILNAGEYRVELVLYENGRYLYDTAAGCRLLGLPELKIPSYAIDPAAGDTLLLLECDARRTSCEQAVLSLRDAGVEVYVAIDSMLAQDKNLQSDREIDAILSRCGRFVDGLVSVSQSGASALAKWHSVRKEDLRIKVGQFRRGSADSARLSAEANAPWAWF